MAKLHGMFREDDAGATDEPMTRERAEELWIRMERIRTVKELEQMLAGAAKRQRLEAGSA